ncbi:glycoside hydrolase family 31 protein [Nostoc sp. CENA67]|uniref:Glycoside hydrolase family 31 protein n=1 Tax=Amazonocrinis nigriterrae CENA67 TaxID=2794033 RepID=A0A8J7L8Z7_9NOST|nr:glycoside hydrolase family 31 protein [Amazonocrinis nigriterrae]MBH8563725.1 glycoside hydrolase family 31 protein [Amazonocrinis nigriterrae CENA67]
MPQYFGQLHTNEAPWSILGAVQGIQQDERHILFKCGDACLRVSVLASNLIRVRMTATGEFLTRRSWAVAQADEQWSIVPFEVREKAEAIEITTEQLCIVVSRNPCRIQCFDSAGQPFAQDADLGMGWRTGAVAGWKQIEADEHFYGFGEPTGLLDQRSKVRTNWTSDALDYGIMTDSMYQTIPFFIALRPGLGYGFFFNTTFWSRFDLGAEQPGVWRMETQGSELDYYIIYGPEPAKILQTYTQLTGQMPLPPRWALGYHQCRWSYESQDVVRKLADEFRQRYIPCDVIHLDIDYMNGYRVFTWSPKRFAHPQELIKELQQDGFKVVTIVDPGVKYEPEADYKVFDEGLKNDYFIRNTNGQLFHGYVWPDKAVFPDFLRPEVQSWWESWQNSLTDIGVAGIWNDMNEPALDDRPFGDPGNKVSFPLDALQGPTDEKTTHAETHNLYGLMMAQASYQAAKKSRPTERSFILTRSGYAGIQRWSAVWTGDNQSLWEHLEMSLPMLCNLGLSGVGFVGADIGGFAGNATAELFARWMQVGILYPLMRGHSALTTAQHEPWVFGDRIEKICREYIELRYQLLPYIYTLFWQAATTGSPILRPLLYDFPNDPKTHTLADQVMLGSSILAAPIYRPGVEHRAVYLPEGCWYDWWSGDTFTGPTHILAHATLERMPLYVRAGAIIPMAPVMQYTDERPVDQMRLRIWRGKGEFTLYEDDGHTFEYQTGAFCTTTYQVITQGQQTIVEISAREGNFAPATREIIVELVGVDEQRFIDDGTAQQLIFNNSQ